MAAVLRSAARRLTGELPAAMGLHRFPLHSQVSVWSASSGRSLLSSGPVPSLSKAKAAMESAIRPPFIPRHTISTSFGRAASQPLDKTKAVIESALSPPFIPRRTMSTSSSRAASQPPDKTKAAMKSTFCPRLIQRRTMSASSGRAASQPADKFCFYLRGTRMTTMLEPGPKELSTMVFNGSEEESLNEFWHFMSLIKKNEFQRAKEMEYIDMQLAYNKEWRKVQNLPWFRKLQKLQDCLSGKVWVLIPGGLLLAGLGESSDWKLPGGPHAPPPGPGEETPFEKSPIEDMF